MDVKKFEKINELVTLETLRKPKIVLDPKGEYSFKSKHNNKDDDNITLDVVFDPIDWRIPEDKKEFIANLAQNTEIDNENKIIMLFEELARSYVYDDNILSYIKKIEDDKFALPDWYGRDVDNEWEENRSEHNKKVCYEVSRILTKALQELFKNNKEYAVCVLWDEPLTHYYCALSNNEYTLTLDLDDFSNIKDLTRVKTDLTIEGIKVLEDPNRKFTDVLEAYNSKKSKHAIRAINQEVKELESQEKEKENEKEAEEENDDIKYLNYVLQILKEEYNLDEQGIFEYMKEIIDIKIGPRDREKVWKKIENEGKDTIYTRCLVLSLEDEKYIIDADEDKLNVFNQEEFEKENPKYIPFKQLARDWEKDYDGR